MPEGDLSRADDPAGRGICAGKKIGAREAAAEIVERTARRQRLFAMSEPALVLSYRFQDAGASPALYREKNMKKKLLSILVAFAFAMPAAPAFAQGEGADAPPPPPPGAPSRGDSPLRADDPLFDTSNAAAPKPEKKKKPAKKPSKKRAKKQSKKKQSKKKAMDQ